MTINTRLRVDGMTCESCARRVEEALLALSGVERASVSLAAASASVDYDPETIDVRQIYEVISAAGYLPGEGSARNLIFALGIGALLIAGYLLVGRLGAFSFVPRITSSVSYGMLFVVGLLTSFHCVAMCGGINLSQSLKTDARMKTAIRAEASAQVAALVPSALYNGGRVVSYTAIGCLAGAVGSVTNFSLAAKAVLTGAAGIFMVLTSLKMFGLLRLPPGIANRVPKFLRGRLFRGAQRNGPFIVGLLNGFLPCGPLQTMQLYALATGSFLGGGFSMLLFSLGTVPLTFAFGGMGNLIDNRFAIRMIKAGAVLVMFLGLLMIGRALNISGMSLTVSSGVRRATVANGIQTFNMVLQPDRYEAFAVRKGVPLRWLIKATNDTLTGCNETITVPAYGIRKKLLPGDNVIEFTPVGETKITYTCWMGMITSSITVLPDTSGFAENILNLSSAATPVPSSSTPTARSSTADEEDCALATIRNGIQEITVQVTDRGYFPAVLVLEKGVKARIKFVLESHKDSDAIVSLPEYRCKLNLTAGRAETPLLDVSRDFSFFCGVGVLHAVAKAVDDLGKADLSSIKRDTFSAHSPARPVAGSDKWYGD